MMASLDHNELIDFVWVMYWSINSLLMYERISEILSQHWFGEWYGVIGTLLSEAVLTKIKQYNINGNMLQYYA